MWRPRYPDRRQGTDAIEADLRSPLERPLISVVMPTYETDPRHLRDAIGSVVVQAYPDWELCIVDDGSSSSPTQREIGRWVARDQRIKARRRERNSGVSAASNEAISLCRGELVAFLDHDDALTADALLHVARAFTRQEIDLAYSDQDKITAAGRRTDPFLKPDWSPVHALGAMYVGHLLVVRRELVREVGGLDSDFDGIQDFELLLRLSERTDRIHHIDRILYHWRAIPGSIALGASEKPGVTELQARAVNDHLNRRGIGARAVPHDTIPHRLQLRPAPRAGHPPVTVVIPARAGAGRALDALLSRTDYPGLEVIVVEPEWASGAADVPPGVVRLTDPGDTFNLGRSANLGAARAAGEWLVFLGEEIEVTQADWIQLLLSHAEVPGVGAVGPTLTRPDGRLDAAGVAIGLYDPVVPVMRGFRADADGYYGSLSCAREVSALGMECMLVRRSTFERAGGFEEAYSRQHQGHDLCMRLAELGLSSVCTPAPSAVSHVTEAQRLANFDVTDRALFVDRWYERLEAGDPYFNRGFFRAAADYALPPFGGDPQEIALREAVG
jgi:GT2 family glycosyltransferase